MTKRSGQSFAKTMRQGPGDVEILITRSLEAICRLYWHHGYLAVPGTISLFLICKIMVQHEIHLIFLAASDQVLFTPERLREWSGRVPQAYQVNILFVVAWVIVIVPLSVILAQTASRYAKIFRTIGLTNSLKEVPALIRERKLDPYRTELILASRGIGVERFRLKRDDLEASLAQVVDTIATCKNPSIIRIIMTTKRLEDAVAYRDLRNEVALPPESFFIGQSLEGPLTKRIADLPHMLIAGSTGSGKSVFFKQVLTGLIESCPHVQMYLLDLKDGLEMTDFVQAPNVAVVKDMSSAVVTLRQIESEMRRRFKFMEKEKIKEIIPERDKMDRIIVAVDEASVLFSALGRHDPDHELTQAARKLIDTLSKLSRAAAINLILATQKLEKQVIPTTVSENISARMAFKANSLQGSLLVTGSKDALDLPEIKGRGIWVYGSKRTVVQAPYIEDKEVIRCCEGIAKDFDEGRRKLFEKMIHTSAAEQGNAKNLKENVSIPESSERQPPIEG